jgi:glycosyltransferase involved in cell wall biosynthesis
MNVNFCIVLPVYNEQECLSVCVQNIAQYLSKIQGRTGIIAVDDGSTDDSRSILIELKKEIPNLILAFHANNQGYGGANRTAARVAYENKYKYALIMDSDGTQAVDYIGDFLPPMIKNIDFIKATRYSKGGGVIDVHWKRVLISRVGNKLAKFFIDVPLTDFTNGFRAIKTDLWLELKTTERGFESLIDEVYLVKKIKGVSFHEVPYILSARMLDGSVSKFTYTPSVYKRYAKYLFKR